MAMALTDGEIEGVVAYMMEAAPGFMQAAADGGVPRSTEAVTTGRSLGARTPCRRRPRTGAVHRSRCRITSYFPAQK